MTSSPFERSGAHQAVGNSEAKDRNGTSVKGLVALPKSVLRFAVRRFSMLKAFALLLGLVAVVTAPICSGIMLAAGGF
jgi:hypothetical protein